MRKLCFRKAVVDFTEGKKAASVDFTEREKAFVDFTERTEAGIAQGLERRSHD